jgi:tetratricopeptide (TPR) repeat protein
LCNKAATLAQLGRCVDALTVFDDLCGRFEHDTDGDVQNSLAVARDNARGARNRLELERATVATDAEVARSLMAQIDHCLEEGRHAEVGVLSDALLARFGNAVDPALRAEVARGLSVKGVALSQLGRLEEAIEAFEFSVEKFGGDREPRPLAMALFEWSACACKLSRFEEAVRVSDACVSRFANSPDPAIREYLAGALNNKAAALPSLGRVAESIDVCDAIVAGFNEFDRKVLNALFNKAASLEQLGHDDQALAVYAQILERFADPTDPFVRAYLVRAFIGEANLLGRLGRHDDVVTSCVKFADRFQAAPELAFRREAAASLYGAGLSLMLMGRLDEALRVYGDVVRRFERASEPEVRQEVAAALAGKGATLDLLGRLTDALHVYTEVLERFGDETELSLLAPVAVALRNAGLAHERLGQRAAARRSYAELEARFGNASDERFREHVEVARQRLAVLQ